eukprot:scaffold140799_cov21-Tisochrysis_lutea.AAC.2
MRDGSDRSYPPRLQDHGCSLACHRMHSSSASWAVLLHATACTHHLRHDEHVLCVMMRMSFSVSLHACAHPLCCDACMLACLPLREPPWRPPASASSAIDPSLWNDSS